MIDPFQEVRNTQVIQHMVDTFLPYCNRWQHVNIYGIPWSALSSFAAARSNLPCLETLRIAASGSGPSLPVTAFEFAPKLHTLDLDHHYDLRIPWGQLTHLIVDNSIAQCHTIFMLVPNITHLNVRLKNARMLSSSYPVIRLSQLTKLKLYTSSTHPERFLDYLSLPMLRDFEYEDEYIGAESRAEESFISLLSRSSCSLWRLSISDFCPLHEDGLIRILQQSPELVELHLPSSTSALTASIISRLIYRQASSGCLVPRLRLLKVYWESHF
jgi:hypothetical protein